MADIFCDTEQPAWVQQECGTELGGIIAVGMIKFGTWVGENDTEALAFLQDDTWWSDGQGASPVTHWVIQETRGAVAAGTPVEEEGFGLVPIERTGDDREATWEALGIMENRDFVAAVNKRRSWGFVYVTAQKDGTGYEAFYVENTSIYMSDTVDQSIKSRKRWTGSTKWSTDMTPGLPFIAPATIFAP